MTGDSEKEELRKVCSAMFQHYDVTAREEVETLQELIDPRTYSKGQGQENTARFRHSYVAKAALDVLVSAHSTYITPCGQRWFALKPREEQKRSNRKSAVSTWYSKATQIIQNELAETSFYTVLQEVYNDRCLGGTGAMFIGGDDGGEMTFTHVPIGSYAIEEDGRGNACMLLRRFRFTAAQAASEWGLDNLSPDVRDQWNDTARRYTEKHEYFHLVRPRGNSTKGLRDVVETEREFEGLYIDSQSFDVMKREGYYEFPFLVTRFLRGNDSPYGVAPGVAVIPVIRQLLKLEKLMDVQAEVATFPRVVQLARQNRQVDLRAGGITTVTPEEAQLGLPREWGTQGRYDIGIDRIERKEAAIKAAFFVDMLNAISNIDRQMTATEINAREAEKVLAFSPSFSLFISDCRPMMRRIMAILFRQDKLPKNNVPGELFKLNNKRVVLMNPQVCYLGKIAQAIERVQRRGINEALESIVGYTQATGDPSMLEALKPIEIARYIVDASGAPDDIIKTDEEIEDMNKQKQQAAEEEKQMQQQALDADTIGKVAGKMKRGGAR